MALTETFTDETRTSASFNSVGYVSELHISGVYVGSLFLDEESPATNSWVNVWGKIVQTGDNAAEVVVLETPNSAMTYRIRAIGIVGGVNVYFGP
jgi:hypothetical protein